MDMGQEKQEKVHFIIIFLLVSFNLRMGFSAADPLLLQVMKSMHMGSGSSGLFGMLPIMALGIAAPAGAVLVRWVPPRRLVVYALLLATLGIIWRSWGSLPGLFGGTLIIGFGLGVAGAVILGVARQVVQQNLPVLMSAYTACVSLGTAVGAGAAAPVARMLGGWQPGLMFWGIPLLLAAALWSIHIMKHKNSGRRSHPLRAPIRPLLHQRNARMITLYYLFRVASAWLLIVWLASLLGARGLPAYEAGLALSVVTACQIPGALLAGTLSHWLGGIHRLIALATLLAVAACWGLLVAPLSAWPWAAMCLGAGLGCIFSVGMSLIAASQPDEGSTIALSGLAQGVGFIGGGLLAWGAGFCVKLPDPCLWMAITYSTLALCGLYFGLQCTEKPAR